MFGHPWGAAIQSDNSRSRIVRPRLDAASPPLAALFTRVNEATLGYGAPNRAQRAAEQLSTLRQLSSRINVDPSVSLCHRGTWTVNPS